METTQPREYNPDAFAETTTPVPLEVYDPGVETDTLNTKPLDEIIERIESHNWMDYDYSKFVAQNEQVVVLRDPKGRSCFARRDIHEGAVIEQCPVVAFTEEVKGTLGLYVWTWKDAGRAVALGLCGSLLNHTENIDKVNVESDYEHSKGRVDFKAKRDIKAGEELYVCYAVGYGVGPSTASDLAPMLNEMNTAVVADMGRQRTELLDELSKKISDCKESEAKRTAISWINEHRSTRIKE